MYLLYNWYVLHVPVVLEVCTCYIGGICCMYLLYNWYVLYVPVV